MAEPLAILEAAFERVEKCLPRPVVPDEIIRKRIETIAISRTQRAGVRLTLSCLLAKAHRPDIDIRKPYLEIRDDRCYSGRTYDESYVTQFIERHRLPCSSPAFSQPILRNINRPLALDIVIGKQPSKTYHNALALLDDVQNDRVTAVDVLAEMFRHLALLREENARVIDLFLRPLRSSCRSLLSPDAIVTLIRQHLACRNASRLPVLAITAAYRAVAGRIGEHPKPLLSHNAADEQTGALGDVEIHLTGEDHTVTSYEMKLKAVTREDIDRAVTKVVGHDPPIHNYLFVTTEPAEKAIHEYAASIYDRLGVEIAILDCLGFIQHLLHFFHRHRMTFLDSYQELLLAEPDSAVRQELKEAFLMLRLAAETGDESSL